MRQQTQDQEPSIMSCHHVNMSTCYHDNHWQLFLYFGNFCHLIATFRKFLNFGNLMAFFCFSCIVLSSSTTFGTICKLGWNEGGAGKLTCLNFFIVNCQMSSQIPCTRGCIVTVVALVWFFSTVCFQMFP